MAPSLTRSLRALAARALSPPEGSHYRGRDPFFEGWYARVTDPASGESFSFLYGQANPGAADATSTAWLMALSGRDHRRLYQPVPSAEVFAAPGHLDLRMGPGIFGPDRVAGRVEAGDEACTWDLRVRGEQRWAGGVVESPMSYALAVPGVETSWHPLWIHARVSGVVHWPGRTVRFEDAPGYTEKVWGRVFPRDWFWLQCNAFDRPDAALCASGGSVPLPGVGVRAAVIGYHDGARLHRFGTHTGARVRVSFDFGAWRLDARTPRTRLEVEAACAPDRLVPLESPTPTGIARVAHESLAGEMHVRLHRRPHPLAPWTLDHAAHSALAGVEIGRRP